MEMLGLYPTWYEPTLGSGWVLGIIAVIHVFASHTSVGAALAFAWLATVAYRRSRPELLEYVRRYGLLQRGNAHWQRLSAMLLNHAKIAVSIAIVLGVAPLLFVQVIYAPFWYTSNLLSARWAIGFIVLLLTGYYALWLHYGVVGRRGEQASPVWLVVSLALILVAGFIMHVLSHQSLSPDKWLSWYAPDGRIDPSGARIHDFSLARWGFIVSLALPVTAAWLIGCRLYLARRTGGEDTGYLDFLSGVARRLALGGGLVSLVLFVAWIATLPGQQTGIAASPWTAAVAGLLLLLALFVRAALNPPRGFLERLPGAQKPVSCPFAGARSGQLPSVGRGSSRSLPRMGEGQGMARPASRSLARHSRLPDGLDRGRLVLPADAFTVLRREGFTGQAAAPLAWRLIEVVSTRAALAEAPATFGPLQASQHFGQRIQQAVGQPPAGLRQARDALVLHRPCQCLAGFGQHQAHHATVALIRPFDQVAFVFQQDQTLGHGALGEPQVVRHRKGGVGIAIGMRQVEQDAGMHGLQPLGRYGRLQTRLG